VPVEAELADLRDRAAAELGVGRALRDPEEELALGTRDSELAPRPQGRAPDGLGKLGRRNVCGRTDVETHCDVGAERSLDRRDRLRREASGSAVVDGAERDAVVVDGRDRVAQREDLKPTGVGKDRPLPAHEAVQAAELGDQVLSRAEVQVIGVAEQDRRAERAQLVRIHRP